MPEFILPDEADRCPYCDRVLRDPPECCAEMIKDHAEDERKRWTELEKRESSLYTTGRN